VPTSWKRLPFGDQCAGMTLWDPWDPGIERTRIAERHACVSDRVTIVCSYPGYVMASELEHPASRWGYLPNQGIAASSEPARHNGLRLCTCSPAGKRLARGARLFRSMQDSLPAAGHALSVGIR
jgi:hypothetical protein